MSGENLFVGQYRLEKTLGTGSFGKVKRISVVSLRIVVATHMKTGIKVAIKILNKERIDQLDMNTKVKREIKILKTFNHPHIVRL